MEINPVAVAAGGRRRGCLSIAGIAALAGAACLDLFSLSVESDRLWPAVLVLALGLAALLWPATTRPRWLTPTVRTATPAAASAAYTAGVLLTGHPVAPGPGEPAMLLCLLLIAARTGRPGPAAASAVLLSAATVALPLRLGAEDLSYSISILLAVLAASVAAVGGSLRSLDRRREDAITNARRTERLFMAAELHDFVAHHVTGMLIQTQLARMLARTDPDRLDPVLEGIEHTAAEALDAMRRTVGVLRDNAGPRLTPTGNLTTLPELITGFQETHHIPAILHSDVRAPETLPLDVQAAAYRLVQEALTNVGRHAADATTATVQLHHERRHLEVTVRDNGHGRPQPPAGPLGGGFGLLGLTERVHALGGQLHAGPRATGGWQLSARLPLSGRPAVDSTDHSPSREQSGP